MGKVLSAFTNGLPGAVSRAVDDIIISMKNTGAEDVPFGAPVFLASGGAKGFDVSSPQAFSAFLGFAVRSASRTPDAYPAGQDMGRELSSGEGNRGCWKAGDVMEILVRGTIALPLNQAGQTGAPVYIRKSDGALTTYAGTEGSTVLLENVRVRNPWDSRSLCAEAVVSRRNII